MYEVEQLKRNEKAILVGVELPRQPHGEVRENLRELLQLAETAGLEVGGTLLQERQKIHPAYFIGSGKVQELNFLLQKTDSQVVIFDEDLSPAQMRNLGQELDVKIIDRSTLILDIFAKHARTRQAKIQVELAQLQYLLPRLTRQWTHLSRQVGGIGTRGPGETQLETDRRLVRSRIEKLQDALSHIDRQRAIRSKNRRNFFRAALIGYTNVGKSTIMNILSGSNVPVENQLFATLDSTNRRIKLNEEHQVLLSDTVGFIRKLPHHLIASFKSTLDVVQEADLLLHVVDVHQPHFQEQMHTVMEVLEELKAHHKPILIIFNKIDLLSEMGILQSLKTQYPGSVFISALQHIGVESLRKGLVRFVEKEFVTTELRIPVRNQKFIHYLHSVAVVEDLLYQDSNAVLTFRCSRNTHQQILKRHRQLSGNGKNTD